MLARSPRLAAISPAHLAILRSRNRGNNRGCVTLLGRVLVALDLLSADQMRAQAPEEPGADAMGVPPEWYAWCQRWRTQSARRDTLAMYHGLLQAGRWVAVTFPAVTTPDAWTQEVALAFVAAVNAKRTGEWARTWVKNNRERAGTPLRPASKAGLLSAVRTFFRDGQEWGWFPVRFNPDRSLRTPRAIRNLIGPDPRVIERPIWAKLVAAGLAVTAEDLPPRCGYPLAMIQALAALWVCTGLRSDELARLRVGCIRWQTADVPLDDAGTLLRKDTVCFLGVPVNKTMTAFTRPVPPIVGQRIAAWERERPAGQGRFRDPTTGEEVDLLFAMRNRRLKRQYLNAVVVPLLCRKAGVPPVDARGRITSHRARASIASMLFNGPEPWTLAELQTFLGHKSPASTQYYARVDPTRLAKKYADTGYLERNLAMVEVLLDIEALRQGTPEVLYYELGHGLCTSVRTVWPACAAHSMCPAIWRTSFGPKRGSVECSKPSP